MKLKSIVLLGSAMAISAASFGQTLKAQKESENNAASILKSAVLPSVVIVQQFYQLTGEDGQTYGLDHAEDFGSAIGVGVIADSALYLDAAVLSPWETDSAYTEFAAVDTLRPTLSRAVVFNLDTLQPDTLMGMWIKQADTLDFKSKIILKAETDSIYQDYIPTHFEKEEYFKEFYLVIYRDSADTEPKGFHTTLHFSGAIAMNPSDPRAALVKSPNPDGFVGGILFKTLVRGGQISFRIGGFLEYTGRIFRLLPLKPRENSLDYHIQNTNHGN